MKFPALGRRLTLALALAGAFAGCESEVQHGLTEKDANAIRVVLSANNIASTKKREDGQSSWMIVVPRGDATRATELLVANHLPPEHQPGLAQIYAQPSMVPTATEEKARLLAALQGELAQTLESVDGVLSARVNVNLPESSDLEDRSKRPQPSAAVVVTYRRVKGQEDKPPFSEKQIKALVARAVPDLSPDNVETVLTPASLPGGDAAGEAFVELAGLHLSPDSVGTFKAFAAVAILAVLGLALWVGALYYQRGSTPPARPTRSPRGAAPEA